MPRPVGRRRRHPSTRGPKIQRRAAILVGTDEHGKFKVDIARPSEYLFGAAGGARQEITTLVALEHETIDALFWKEGRRCNPYPAMLTRTQALFSLGNNIASHNSVNL